MFEVQEQKGNPEGEEEKKEKKIIRERDVKISEIKGAVPLSKNIIKKGNRRIIEYEWFSKGDEELKISIWNLEREDEIENIYKIKVKDGEERAYLKEKKSVYFFIKADKDSIERLYSIRKKLGDYFLKTVGYLKSVKGNYYLVTKEDVGLKILQSKEKLKRINPITREEKLEFIDDILETLLQIYKKGIGLEKIKSEDIAVIKNKIKFLNPLEAVNLEEYPKIKKVEYFINNLKNLLELGIIRKGDFLFGITLFFLAFRKEYEEWKNEKRIKSDEEALDYIEKFLI